MSRARVSGARAKQSACEQNTRAEHTSERAAEARKMDVPLSSRMHLHYRGRGGGRQSWYERARHDAARGWGWEGSCGPRGRERQGVSTEQSGAWESESRAWIVFTRRGEQLCEHAGGMCVVCRYARDAGEGIRSPAVEGYLYEIYYTHYTFKALRCPRECNPEYTRRRHGARARARARLAATPRHDRRGHLGSPLVLRVCLHLGVESMGESVVALLGGS